MPGTRRALFVRHPRDLNLSNDIILDFEAPHFLQFWTIDRKHRLNTTSLNPITIQCSVFAVLQVSCIKMPLNDVWTGLIWLRIGTGGGLL